MAIEISTKSIEAAAQHEASRSEQVCLLRERLITLLSIRLTLLDEHVKEIPTAFSWVDFSILCWLILFWL
jgi:hypothetical protein